MSEPANANQALKNLDKWQAYSHPDLVDRKPEELFPADFAERYGPLHRDVWQRIVRLHGTIRTLETMEPFPFKRIYAPTEMQFWRLVWTNFGDIAVLLLHGLVNDSASDANTLLSFKNKVRKGPWLDKELHDDLMQALRVCKFDSEAKFVARRVGQIRDHRIAHPLFDVDAGDASRTVARVTLSDLRKLFDPVHALFGALSFGSAYVTLAGDLMPGTVGGKPRQSCLDELLDAVLRESYLVNQPERCANFWPSLRERMPREDLQEMNELRRRVGLPDA